MGCDIHAYIEYRGDYRSDGWQLFADLNLWRNYSLFSLLAGVRGELESVYAPRGLPDDVSWSVRLRYDKYRVDWHNASYLTPREYRHALLKYRRYIGADPFEGYEDYGAALKAMEAFAEARIVFWFDN